MIDSWTIFLQAKVVEPRTPRPKAAERPRGPEERGYESSRFRERYEDRSERRRDGRGKDLRPRHE